MKFLGRRARAHAVATTGSQLAWGIWGFVIALMCVAMVSRLINLSEMLSLLSGPHWWAEIIWWSVLVPVGVLAFATAGAMVVSRDLRSRLGWLMLSLAVLSTVHDLAWQYAVWSVHLSQSSLPGQWVGNWLALIVTPAMLIVLFALILLHFPNGQLVSRRWRNVLWLAGGVVSIHVLTATIAALAGTRIGLQRPSALTVDLESGLRGLAHGLVEFLAAGALLLAAISIFSRWRTATGIERQRLKWLGYVGAMIGLAMSGWILALTLSGGSYITLSLLSVNLGLITIGVPVAIGIAILRYQLFDIDLVINRTLVYSILSIILGSGYVGGVLGLQLLLGQFLGGQDLAIVIATILAATAVRPVRDRIQENVDRRFYHAQYDATRTLSNLARSMRDDFDLYRLQRSIVAVVDETMQPASISIWMSGEADPQGQNAERRERRVG